MSQVVISVEGLGKKYTIGHSAPRERYTALRDVIAQGMRSTVRKAGDLFHGRPIIEGDDLEELWALRDVTFDVKCGEVLGIIGRNGAGKSTLLKIFSRITEPSKGRVTIRGRVASLLEVGTGFHPELTGRENIFLNGAVLGMRHGEIKRKLDEIVAFSETEKFLDTPVKRYSSGMYVRMAFAVAAHLESDILIVDEVLAVGDAEFQKRCLGKMDEIAQKQGRTVLFVSHNMATVNRLCQRCILLDAGQIVADSHPHTITGLYMTSNTGTMAARVWSEPAKRPGDAVARLNAMRVIQNGQIAESIDIRYSVDIEMDYECLVEGAQLLSAMAFFDAQGNHLFVSADFADEQWGQPRRVGNFRSVCRVPGNLFGEGFVRVVAEVSTRKPVYQTHFLEFDSVGFQVVDTGEPGSVRAGWGRPIPGVLRPMCEWQTFSSLNAPNDQKQTDQNKSDF